MALVLIDRRAHRGEHHTPTRGRTILPYPLQVPNRAVDDAPTDVTRTQEPPPVVIKVTIGIDPQARRDPSKRDDASPYFATTSEAPRTP